MKKGKEVGNMTQCEYCLEIGLLMIDEMICEACDILHFGE